MRVWVVTPCGLIGI